LKIIIFLSKNNYWNKIKENGTFGRQFEGTELIRMSSHKYALREMSMRW
jgi:hypothetical protein